MTNETKIDFKKRYQALEQKELNGWVSFTAQSMTEQSLNELAALSKQLGKIGISVEVTRKENTETGMSYDFVVFKVNEEQYKSVTTRNAGRKADFKRKYESYKKCTVAELKEKLKTTNKSKIAEELGCSRMTLYRILHNIEERKPAEDTSIWHYTS